MNKKIKSLTLTCLAGVVFSLFGGALAHNNFETSHGVCAIGGEHFHYDRDNEIVNFEPIYDMDDFLDLLEYGGSAYLANDITITPNDKIIDGEILVSAQKINLCLNGHVLNLNRLCHLRSRTNFKAHQFAVYDCNKTIDHVFDTTSCPWTLDPQGDTVIKSGIITGGYAADECDGGFLELDHDEDEIIIYGGSIVGNEATRYGGAFNSWFLSMYGGEVCGNKALVGGGAFYSTESNKLLIRNVKIHHNESPLGGGGITMCAILEGTSTEIYNNTDGVGNKTNLTCGFVINDLHKGSNVFVDKFDGFGFAAPTIFEVSDDANDFLLSSQPEFRIKNEIMDNLDNTAQMFAEEYIQYFNLSRDKIFIFDAVQKLENTITNFVMEDYFAGGTPSTPSASATNGTPTFAYSTEEYGVYTETAPTEIGTYWVRAKVEESDNYYKAVARKQFNVKEPEPEKPVVIEIEGGVPNDVTVEVEVTVETEVESAILDNKITDYSKLSDDVKLENFETVGVVFDVKLIRTTGGQKEEIQPSDIKPGTVVKVKIKIPDGVDISKITRIIHVHSGGDVESYAFDPTKIDSEGYYTLYLDKFSELAFVYNVSTELDISRNNCLSSIYETILVLKAIGYDVSFDKSSNDFGILDIVNAPNEAILRDAYLKALKSLNNHVDSINSYRAAKIGEIVSYANTKEVVVTSSYLSYFESLYTTTKLDEATATIKAEIDDVFIKQSTLNNALTNLSNSIANAINNIGTANTNLGNLSTLVDDIKAILNDSSNGLAAININVGNVDDLVGAQIDSLKNALVADYTEKINSVISDISDLNTLLGSLSTSLDSSISDLETQLTSLVNLKTSDIASLMSGLESKVSGVETNLTTLINNVKSSLSDIFNSKISEIKSDIMSINNGGEGSSLIIEKINELKTLVNGLEDIADNSSSDVKNSLTSLITNLDEKISNLEETLNSKLQNIPTDDGKLNALIVLTCIFAGMLLAGLGFIIYLLFKDKKIEPVKEKKSSAK